MLTDKDEVVLIDFGLAKQYDSATGHQTSSTPVGISEGYAPLEQYMQGGVGEFSPETDIYALGATYYKLLTGQTPPSASSVNEDGLPRAAEVSWSHPSGHHRHHPCHGGSPARPPQDRCRVPDQV